MRAGLHVFLLVLVYVAGCTAVSGGNTTSSPTTTEDTQMSLPYGLLEDGVTDASALVTAHTDALETENYTARKRVVVTAPNGTVLTNFTHVSRVGQNRTRAVDTQ